MTEYMITAKGRRQANKLEESRILRAASLVRHAIYQFLKTNEAATLEEIEAAAMSHHVSWKEATNKEGKGLCTPTPPTSGPGTPD